MHRSTKWIRDGLVFVILAIVLVGVLGYPQFLSYQSHRFLHILGAVLLLGNVIVTAMWMVLAGRTKNAAVAKFSSEAVSWADVFFTVPGIFLLITNGDILAQSWGGVFKTGWIAVSLVLFALAGILWTGLLLRYQAMLIKLSRVAAGEQPSPDFMRIVHGWYVVGAIATVLPLASLALMVFKPRMW